MIITSSQQEGLSSEVPSMSFSFKAPNASSESRTRRLRVRAERQSWSIRINTDSNLQPRVNIPHPLSIFRALKNRATQRSDEETWNEMKRNETSDIRSIGFGVCAPFSQRLALTEIRKREHRRKNCKGLAKDNLRLVKTWFSARGCKQCQLPHTVVDLKIGRCRLRFDFKKLHMFHRKAIVKSELCWPTGRGPNLQRKSM